MQICEIVIEYMHFLIIFFINNYVFLESEMSYMLYVQHKIMELFHVESNIN